MNNKIFNVGDRVYAPVDTHWGMHVMDVVELDLPYIVCYNGNVGTTGAFYSDHLIKEDSEEGIEYANNLKKIEKIDDEILHLTSRRNELFDQIIKSVSNDENE
jgi:hypothetical protein